VVVGAIVLLFAFDSPAPESVRQSNENIGLSPPACMGSAAEQKPVKCEEEKAEAHKEEEGAKEAEQQKEAEKRAKEEGN
jgi:hypothetical protein